MRNNNVMGSCCGVLMVALATISLAPAQADTFDGLEKSFCQIFKDRVRQCSTTNIGCDDDLDCPGAETCDVLQDFQDFVDEHIEVQTYVGVPGCTPEDGRIDVQSHTSGITFRLNIQAFFINDSGHRNCQHHESSCVGDCKEDGDDCDTNPTSGCDDLCDACDSCAACIDRETLS